jgi:hypothetical protein
MQVEQLLEATKGRKLGDFYLQSTTCKGSCRRKSKERPGEMGRGGCR